MNLYINCVAWHCSR